MTDSSRLRSSASQLLVSLTVIVLTAAVAAAPPAAAASTTRLIPIVLDVFSGSAHFTTEVSLTNAEKNVVFATLRYTASIGTKEGSGSALVTIAAGRQYFIGDVLAFLRNAGLPIPSGATGQQGGTLLVTFDGVSGGELVASTARTTTVSGAPGSTGSAGLAQRGLAPKEQQDQGRLTIFGLRANDQDRSNVAVFNPDPARSAYLRITAFSGAGDGASKVLRDPIVLDPLGWAQLSFGDESGYANGWVVVESEDGGSPLGAYGVINDNVTNDGTAIAPVRSTALSGDGGYLNLPVIVESASFQSELTLANDPKHASDPRHAQVFDLYYKESLHPDGGSGTVRLTLGPGEQRIIPSILQFLRDHGVALAPAGSGSFGGTLHVIVPDSDIRDVTAQVRIASPSAAGGGFGLSTPALLSSQAVVATDAYIFGLLANDDNRSNVAVFNWNDGGTTADGPAVLSIQVYDGEQDGAPVGSPEIVTVNPGEWKQVDDILGTRRVKNGWVRIHLQSDTSANHAWAAYGVINDGAKPGQRTGDGAYIAMEPSPR